MNRPTAHTDMQAQWASSHLNASNAAYLEQLFEQYLQDPHSVPERWRGYFDQWVLDERDKSAAQHSQVREQFRRMAEHHGPYRMPLGRLEQERKQVHVLQLITTYRLLGHRHAQLDPLGLLHSEPLPELSLAHHQLSEDDLDIRFNPGTLYCPDNATLRQILGILRDTYSGHLGVEYMHLIETTERRWLQQRLETVRGRPHFEATQQRYILERLTAAEGLERYLHSRYVGQKRFSLEGGESLIPMLDALIQQAGTQGVRELVIGMAHRGRLNVLVNILGKSPQELFQEFEGIHQASEGTGDVKYHMGFSSDMHTPGGPVHLALAFNPSHLEIVGPVVEGSARARQERGDDREGDHVLPVLLHGDAAFAGQGVIMETLNMSQTRGFSTKGTVHIVINNQIGFTTSTLKDARSTYYCTDVAKMANVPILHVNADHPEMVVFATRIALEYRMTFKKDVVIDLVCYRRHGHNEVDEPNATQPLMYQRIKALPTTRALYAQRLVELGVLEEHEPGALEKACRAQLEAGENMVPHLLREPEKKNPQAVNWRSFIGIPWQEPTDTCVPLSTLQTLWKQLRQLPEGFELHPRVAKIMDDRHKMAAGSLPLDWGFGETMAYATLLSEGYPVRLSGQDSGRGTFFHRHAVLFNQKDERRYVPLRELSADTPFLVIDSLLSEEAVLAFEYGYATAAPDTLVIWEAQFGDFANGAQVVIDQFISSGEQKWGRLCGLVLLLPHGYEGQGPEHSSARLERFLQLSAQHNMQVCVPSTPAQIFHLLRRQMRRPYRKPLIVMTPKSLLRHKLATSRLEDLSEGRFHNVLDEIDPLAPEAVTRILICAGKIYYDLLEARRLEELSQIAIIRLEQIYPFPDEEMTAILARYPNAQEFIWVQEEPLNQGAWYASQHHIRALLGERRYLQHIARPASASPAVGYFDVHVRQQKELIQRALG
ncbi:2-oxoglutarate dehydrogenase E1 component [Thiorhodospira sibirica]|uniref:2-oxoglutarate dehydrogenase E1 component n=1 Tax=Thiorhodospira sibirica TaxID=154347 RepID=UPI00022C4675|nr:2-oxoglutarate dehydrogenase E1 component [Thiorhodospira sibirica]